MNIALINGPGPSGSLFTREGRCTQRASIWSTQWPPITLAYLAAVAHEAGHEGRVYDCPAAGLSAESLLAKLRALRPDICVLAISTPSFYQDMGLADQIKAALPGAKIGVLGVHATAMDQSVLEENAAVDFAVRGEPEDTFSEVLAAVAGGRDLSGVKGVTFRGSGGVKRNAAQPYITDLDRLPFPRWSALNLGSYRLPLGRQRFLCLTPLRGCPHRCSFCSAGSYYGRQVRYRTPESVVEEILHCRRQYGVRNIFMWAETFTLNRRYVMKLCQAIARDAPGTRWTCNSRPDTVDPELLRAMASAGCWMISFGLESSDPGVLERAEKNLRSMDFAAPVRQAREAGMKTLGHFVLGLPGDTRQTIRRTVRTALSLDLDFAQFYTAAPFVGTPLHEEAVRDGLIDPEDFSSMSQSAASMRLKGLSPGAVDRERARATRKFYLRPRQLWRLSKLTIDQLWAAKNGPRMR